MIKQTLEKPAGLISLFISTLLRTVFLVGAGVIFALTLSAFITPDLINILKKNISAPVLILYAELIGFISPGPRYIIYPILAKLMELSVGAGVIIALISGHVLIEPSTVFIEAGFFGYRFPIKRFIISFLLTLLAGMLTVILTDSFGWSIF